MVGDGHFDCPFGIEETRKIITNCTHDQLFLCVDQSRCSPKKLKCNGFVNCIDGSDEIEGCEYTQTYFRYFVSNKAFIHAWSNFAIRFDNESFSDIIRLNQNKILERNKKIVSKNMFGLKCKSTKRNIIDFGYYLKNVIVPQPKFPFSLKKTYCSNKEDSCFDQFGKLTCFKCFDGTIVLKSQVCDGTIDCNDLSDECACENSEVQPLCGLFHKYKNLNNTKHNFSLLCNLEYDLPEGIDEKYCSSEIMFIFAIYTLEKVLENGSEQKCAKGQTAFNRSFDVCIRRI